MLKLMAIGMSCRRRPVWSAARFVALVLVTAGEALAAAALYHVDQPVPVSLAHAEYYGSVRLWGEGGGMVRFAVGLFDRVTLGMSYSANRLLGSAAPVWARPRPEFQARLALLLEEGYVPDLLLGFESQGYDGCDGERFQVSEKGPYLCVGKTIGSWRTYAEMGLNYWNGLDCFLVLNQSLPGAVELVLEYDPAFNDKSQQNGFLNAGVGWTLAERVRVGLALRDILGARDETRLNRVFDVSFVQHF
jgi:hypothetical protein